MIRAGFWALVLTASSAMATVPFPANNFPYFGKIQVSNSHVQNSKNVTALRDEATQACRVTHRALFAIENYWEEIREAFGTNGPNFSVLYNNKALYRRKLSNRYGACTGGQIKLNLHGRCGTDRETVAFVKVTFGFVGTTIHICDEYFPMSQDARVSTLVHEYGRLENIGDSPNFDTNNIYVWDNTIGRLGELRTFQDLADRKAKKKP